MARPHAAARVEDAWHRQLNGMLRHRGWVPRAIGHLGYGSTDFVRVLGRIVLTRHPKEYLALEAAADQPKPLTAEGLVRGWRAFLTAQELHSPVVITINGVEHRATCDRSGYVDHVITGHGLPPGQHDIRIAPEGGVAVRAQVQIIDPDVGFGIVSDIDDTVITTLLPRPMLAAWNTFVLQEQARHIVPGMAPMYRELLAEHPGAPIFYLSTGAWNAFGALRRFLVRHNYPLGPLLLTDWGPTNTGWFRSGQEHKQANLHRLAREFPRISWLLVGDDGQHDPRIYQDFARDRPDVVRAIAIRELSPAEQVLSHGIPVSNEEFAAPRVHRAAPVVRAGDGYDLLPQVRAALTRTPARP